MSIRQPIITFRTKLIFALLATVIPLVVATLVVIRQETQRQVHAFVSDALQRSHRAFQQVEQQRQNELLDAAVRVTSSNRIAGALQTALEEGDTAFLAEAATYDLSVRGFSSPLSVFTDLRGRPVVVIMNGRAVRIPNAVPRPMLERMLQRGDTTAYGYNLIGDHIYSTQTALLRIVDRPIGTITIGSQIDDDVARKIGGALVDAQVCFVANGQCVASTSDMAPALRAQMPRALGGARTIDVDGKRWAVVSDRLSVGSTQPIWWATAIPLDAVLQPFARIEGATRVAAIGALLLAILVALVLSRGLIRPVRKLVIATERVAKGDYTVSVEEESRDELGTLARSFNEMTHGLLLKEHYRGMLDKVISPAIAEEMLKGDVQLGGELREVTMLFADIRGFTSMTQGMNPQRVIQLLNDVMEQAGAAIEAEGGVVDKYVGDEIMGLFGAPIAHVDDPVRAVRAAVAIRDAVAIIDHARRQRGESRLEIGIGVNTGRVVAGNMGSINRLNYTVIGEAVNLAGRLCADAQPSQILITTRTRERIPSSEFEMRPAGIRKFKGLTYPVEVFDVIGTRAYRAVSYALVFAAGLAALSLAGAQRVQAQDRAIPTLQSLGLRYVSPSGFLQVLPTARVELNGFFIGEGEPWLIPVRNSFAAPRASLFTDVFVGSHLYGLVEARVDRGEEPSDTAFDFRLEQFFVRGTVADVSLQLGRFVSPFGAYPQRHHSSSDAFIRPPLPYEYRTMASSMLLASSNDSWIDWKSSPFFNFRPFGAPPVWGAPYQLGAMVLFTRGIVSARGAVVNSAPSSEPSEWNQGFQDPSYIGSVGVQVLPELHVGASYNTGPYLQPTLQTQNGPVARPANDFDQNILGFDATFTRGRIEARGEFLYDTWYVPNVIDESIDISYYIESKVKLSPEFFVAGRFNAITFNRIHRSNGVLERWDNPARRWQVSAGYRFVRNGDIRAEFMRTTVGGTNPDSNLLSVRASLDL